MKPRARTSAYRLLFFIDFIKVSLLPLSLSILLSNFLKLIEYGLNYF